MNKLKISALLLAAVLSAVTFAGCGEKKNDKGSNISYIENSEIGKNKHETQLGTAVTVAETTFIVNNVIDVNEVTEDGGKYIFLDYTIKNDSSNDFKMNNINNFYLMIGDEKYNPDVRAKLFAKQSINNYADTDVIAAGTEATNYVGFVIPPETQSITFGYYVTEDNLNSKEDVVICSIESSEWIQPPEGMLK